MGLRRTNIYLTENETKQLVLIAKQKELSMAELIRRILDDWLEKHERKANK
jgi:predicted DNA-binding ribbon-helix-helix protein